MVGYGKASLDEGDWIDDEDNTCAKDGEGSWGRKGGESTRAADGIDADVGIAAGDGLAAAANSAFQSNGMVVDEAQENKLEIVNTRNGESRNNRGMNE